MSVIVENMQRNSGAPVVLNFTDEFNAAAGAYLGNNWNCIAAPDNGQSGPNVDISINVAGGQAIFGDGSAVNYLSGRVLLFPNTVYLPRIQQIAMTPGRGQFSQVKLTTYVAGNGATLIGVLYKPTSLFTGGYALFIDGGTTAVGLAGHGMTFSANVFNFSINDVIRLEAIFVSSAKITLNVFQNGILRGTFDDTSAGRIIDGGMYGLFWVGSLTSRIGFDTYSGGVI